MNKWITYKRRLLELQDTLNKNPVQDAFIALAIEILLALLEDKIEKTAVCVGEVKTELCKSCYRQNYCGNNTQKNYCAGYAPYVETRWDADDIKTPPFTQGLKKIIQATKRLNKKGKHRGVDDDV